MKDEKELPDRVWYSDGLKLNMGDYQSAEAGPVGYSSNVRPGESVEEAFARVRKVVEAEVLAKAKRVRRGMWKEVL